MTNFGHEESSAQPPVLAVKNMVKTREKGGVRFELRIPSLKVAAGEFLAVVGASG